MSTRLGCIRSLAIDSTAPTLESRFRRSPSPTSPPTRPSWLAGERRANELSQRSDFFPQELEQIEIFLFTRNSCTGESSFGSGLILDPDLHWSSTVRADMTGSVAIFDFVTGAPMGTVAFDLLFTGVGQTFRFQSHQQLEFPPFRLVQHSEGAFRNAALSGTITLDGQEFIGNVGSASLGKSRSGTIQMTRD